jgi:flagellar biosynthesis protein FlhG
MIPVSMNMSLFRRAVWTIGGGEGGIGKSFLTAALGMACARSGRSVIVVDANTSAPDLHSHLGIKPPAATLLDVLWGRAGLSEAIAATPEPSLQFLSCVGEEPGMADLTAAEREQMSDCIRALDAEVILVDVGTGTSCQTLDFFNLSSEAIIVAPPTQAAMQCAFRFLRNAAFRRIRSRFGFEDSVEMAIRQLRQTQGNGQSQTMAQLIERLAAKEPEIAQSVSEMLKEWHPCILINLTSSEHDLRQAEIIGIAAKKLLNVELRPCGRVDAGNATPGSAQGHKLPDLDDSADPRAAQVRQIAQSLMPSRGHETAAEVLAAPSPAGVATAPGLNNDVALKGRSLHVQTEDLGPAGSCIATQVFCEGRVLLSTKSEYPSTMRDPQHMNMLFELMRTQHFNVIRQIESWNYPPQSACV